MNTKLSLIAFGLRLLNIFLFFSCLYPVVSNGILTPTINETVRGKDFIISLPDPKTETHFCFLHEDQDEERTLLIISFSDFWVTQDGNEIIPTRGDDKKYRILMEGENATGCWHINRDSSIEQIRFVDSSYLVLENSNIEASNRLQVWRISFWLFMAYVLIHAFLNFLGNYSYRKEKVEEEVVEEEIEVEEVEEKEPGNCTHCGNTLKNGRCHFCGAPQNKK